MRVKRGREIKLKNEKEITKRKKVEEQIGEKRTKRLEK